MHAGLHCKAHRVRQQGIQTLDHPRQQPHAMHLEAVLDSYSHNALTSARHTCTAAHQAIVQPPQHCLLHRQQPNGPQEMIKQVAMRWCHLLAPSSSMSATTTLDPSWPRQLAQARPMPLAAPAAVRCECSSAIQALLKLQVPCPESEQLPVENSHTCRASAGKSRADRMLRVRGTISKAVVPGCTWWRIGSDD